MRILLFILYFALPLAALSDNYKVVIGEYATKSQARKAYEKLHDDPSSIVAQYAYDKNLIIHFRKSGGRYIIAAEPFSNSNEAKSFLKSIQSKHFQAFVSKGIADDIQFLLAIHKKEIETTKEIAQNISPEPEIKTAEKPSIPTPIAVAKVEESNDNLWYFLLITLMAAGGWIYWREYRFKKLKREHAELTQEKERIQESIQAKNDFIAMMSHEIRAPINAIMGMSHLVLESRLTITQRSQISKIKDSASLLLNLINDILDHSKIEAGKVTIEQIPFDLNALLDDISNIISHKANEKHIELIFDIDRSVPNKLIGDPLRLLQVLVNLLNNAIKFTEQGHVILRARGQQISRLNLKIHFEVIDTGIGMDQGQIAKLFQSYTQADESITRKYGGTGLGLAICKNLVSLMGGSIQVSSKPNIGSTFSFNIKLHSDFDFEKRHYRLPSTDLMSKNALILDDSSENASVLQRGLEYFHYEVKSISESSDVVALFKNYAFDIVFIDTKMALSGEFKRELQNRIKEDALKLVWMGEDIKKRGGYILSKPFNQLDIFNTVLAIYGYMDQSGKHQNNTKKLKESLKKFGGETLLLAEDNEINRSIIAGLLAGTDIVIVTAETGRQAVDIVNENPNVNVILMDIQMPIMDGFEASRIIRLNQDFDPIPIIAVTGNTLESDIQNISNAGMNGHIAKPIDVNTFYTTLYYAFEKSHNHPIKTTHSSLNIA